MSDNDPNQSRSIPASRRQILTVAAGVGAGSVATGAVAADDGEPTDEPDETNGQDSDGEEPAPFAAIEFSNQFSDGTEISIDATVLSEGGYVAIHDGTLLEGDLPGSVIGVSEYLGRGVHYDVSLALFDVPGAEFDQDTLEGTTPLIAMPHRETGDNQTYEFVESGGEADGAYAEAGLPVHDAGFVAVDGGDDAPSDAPFATVDFENQPVSEGAVTVREAVLSDGGFVTLHDARLLEGMPLESVVGVSAYLEPGRHQAVEVAIDDPSAIAEVALPARPLFPMPHLDTNGNQTYDFVDTQGEEDGPYVKGPQAVIDAGLVTLED